MSRNSVIPVFIPHAGCPYHCVFCNQHSISGATAVPSPDEVTKIICSAAEKLSAPAELAFYGGSFTCLPIELQTEYLEAASPFFRSGVIDKIRVSTRPDAIDDTILSNLKHYGVRTVELGCQSMDDTVLLASGRGHTSNDIQYACQKVKEYGLSLIIQLMFGLPGDTDETARKSCVTAVRLNPDGIRMYPTVVIKDTELYSMTLRGEYTPMSVEKAVDLCSDLFGIFAEARIPVIRLGLNPSDDLSGGLAVGGAYHPSLGELTRSRFFYKKICSMLQNIETAGKHLTIGVNPSRLSIMAGQHRRNIIDLKKEFHFRKVTILPCPLSEDEIQILSLQNDIS